MSNTPDFDAILNADTGLDKDQNDPQKSPEDRLSKLSNATEANMGPMQKMLRGTEVRGTIIAGSKFEESYFTDSIPFVLRNRIKGKIFDVLGDTGRDYANVQVNGSDSLSKIEREIWTQKLDTTLDAVRRQKTNSQASLSVIEGLSGILQKSTDAMRAQWEEKATEAREFLDNRDIFFKIAGLRKKARFEKYSKRFLKNLEEKKAQVQASLNMVKTRKENDMNEAKNKLQAKLAAHNNQDSTERNALWKFVTESVKDPTIRSLNVNGTAITARSFGIKEHGDFLEALIALGYTTKADQLGKTAALSADTETVISKFSGEETAFKTTLDNTATPPEQNAPKNVQDKLKACVSPAKDPVESVPKLVADLEKTIRSKKPNFITEVYGGPLQSPQQKLWKIISYLNINPATRGFEVKELNRTTLQEFLRYMKDIDKNTQLQARVDNVEDKVEDYLNDTVLKMKDLWEGVNPLDSFTDITTLDYGVIQSKITTFIDGVYRTNFKDFETTKENLAPEIKVQYEQKWERLSVFKEKLEALQKDWKEQKKRYQSFKTLESDPASPGKLSDRETQLRNTLESIRTGGLNDTKGTISMQTNSELQKVQEKWEYLLEFGGDRTNGPDTVSSTKIKSFYESSLEEKTAKYPLAGEEGLLATRLVDYKTINTDAGDFDKRFRDHLMEEYQTEQEKQLEENLKTNTTKEWEILNMSPEGELVEVNYYDTLGVSTLPSAKELNEPDNQEKVGRLRIVKKTEKGIVLEHPTQNKTYVLSGPTEKKDGVWSPNLGVYNQKGSAIQPGSSVAGIILGINLNA